MTPAELADRVLTAARAALTDHCIDPSVLPATAKVERPRQAGHGDYATSLALQAARPAALAPRELAAMIADRISADPDIRRVDIAGPGFLNITLQPGVTGTLPDTIIGQGAAYGRATKLAGQRLNLEFVSSNPTGPVHAGSARWAAVGDALARLLRAAGANVVTEYYFNDAGGQIDRFANSLLASARGEPPPDDGYTGSYISEIAQQILAAQPDAADKPRDVAVGIFGSRGVALMFEEIKSSLAHFGVTFDVYANERELRDSGAVAGALARLDELGHVYAADGASWLRTSSFGDDKDRVLRRGTGEFTYFAADCAYYLDKRSRGFGRVLIILGADHHGYVGRMRAMAACFGDDPDQTLEILIGQLVNLVRDGGPTRMSKRAGTVVTLDDLVAAIGADAARYALARYSLDATIDLDLDLWARRSADNPVYYVQYAHARIAALRRHASQLGIATQPSYDPALLRHDRENDLLKTLADFPRVVLAAAELRQPHRVARYLEQLAGDYHRFNDACRVLPRAGQPDAATTQARLWLAEATQIVLASGLGLLGVSAPDRL